MPAPKIHYITLAQHTTKFAAIRQADAVPGHPIPDLQAARYSLTGWNPESTYITGINTSANLIGDIHEDQLPYIRHVTTTPSLDSAWIVQFPKICCTSLIRLYHIHKANCYTLSMNVKLEFRSVMSIKFSILHLPLTLFRFSMSCPVLCQMFSLVHLV